MKPETFAFSVLCISVGICIGLVIGQYKMEKFVEKLKNALVVCGPVGASSDCCGFGINSVDTDIFKLPTVPKEKK